MKWGTGVTKYHMGNSKWRSLESSMDFSPLLSARGQRHAEALGAVTENFWHGKMIDGRMVLQDFSSGEGQDWRLPPGISELSTLVLMTTDDRTFSDTTWMIPQQDGVRRCK
jgi:hypothetical protein